MGGWKGIARRERRRVRLVGKRGRRAMDWSTGRRFGRSRLGRDGDRVVRGVMEGEKRRDRDDRVAFIFLVMRVVKLSCCWSGMRQMRGRGGIFREGGDCRSRSTESSMGGELIVRMLTRR
jgi:hypothetical protein